MRSTSRRRRETFGRVKLCAALIMACNLTGGLARAIEFVPPNFAEYGMMVNGYADFFQGTTLNPGWTLTGNATWMLPGDGYLHSTSGTLDPSKLLFTGAPYDGTVQNVLAEVRVTAFGPNGDTGSRAGVTTVSSPATAPPGQGINYIYYGDGNGIQRSEFLNDYVAHGPRVVTPGRAIGTDYWIRLLHEPNKPAGADPAFNGANDAFAKIWPADGTTPEPANFQYSWASNDTRTGFAGLMIGTDSTTTMEVGYVLIQASGLPNIAASTFVPPVPPTPTNPSALGNYGRAVLASQPVAYWRLETNLAPPADSADAAGFPQYGAQNGVYQNIDPHNLGQPGPRPSDMVGGMPLLGFAPDNHAADFQGNGGGGDDVALFADDGHLNLAPAASFTLEAWVKGAPIQPEAGAPIIAKGVGTREQFTIDLVGNHYRFYVRDGANPDSPSVLQTSVGPDDTWQHVVGVFDANENLMKVYVNGQEVGANLTLPLTIIDNAHDISVGSRQSGNAAYDFNFDGLIDEVAVYAYALGNADIQAHYQAAFVPEPSTLTLLAMALGVFAGGRLLRAKRRG